MRRIFLTILFVGLTIAQGPQPPTKPRGVCPRTKPGIGICVFNPEINCTGDNQCKDGKLCCPDGCNRSCMDAVPPPEEGSMCPLAGIQPVGPCLFDPKVNCLKDADCNGNQVCCSHGCNKICKDPSPRPLPPFVDETPSKLPVPPNNLDRCPAAAPSIGACRFDANINCFDDSACYNGQICCPEGCNKVCKSPIDDKSDPSKIPISPIDDKTDPARIPISSPNGSCPPAPATGFLVGACVFDAKVNCVDDAECKGGKLCCPSGCNKVCMNPQPVAVHAATKP